MVTRTLKSPTVWPVPDPEIVPLLFRISEIDLRAGAASIMSIIGARPGPGGQHHEHHRRLFSPFQGKPKHSLLMPEKGQFWGALSHTPCCNLRLIRNSASPGG